jgi:hypothetical protein
MRRWIILAASHGAMLAAGFALGVYLLPILTAPEGPDATVLAEAAEGAVYTAAFRRDLKGSDFLHWGEGTVSLSPGMIAHQGRLAPGPDYKLYLVPEFVEDEAGFHALKDRALRLGDVKTFDGFVLDVPPGVALDAYTTVLVWCEAFSEFITAARYR